MKKFNLPALGSIILGIAVVAVLTGCSASCDSAGAIAPSATPTEEPLPAEPIEAFPAIGEQKGVITDPNDPTALICDEAHASVPVDLYRTVDYNGSVISPETEARVLDPGEEGLLYDQYYSTVQFSGEPLDVTSVIVHSSDGYTWVEADGSESYLTWNDGDKSFNVTPEMIADGIMLKPFQFVNGLNYIQEIDLCVAS